MPDKITLLPKLTLRQFETKFCKGLKRIPQITWSKNWVLETEDIVGLALSELPQCQAFWFDGGGSVLKSRLPSDVPYRIEGLYGNETWAQVCGLTSIEREEEREARLQLMADNDLVDWASMRREQASQQGAIRLKYLTERGKYLLTLCKQLIPRAPDYKGASKNTMYVKWALRAGESIAQFEILRDYLMDHGFNVLKIEESTIPASEWRQFSTHQVKLVISGNS